ncbi:hypothetical protein H920_09192 [Fukomys damarensis]|uniref:Uncharacterized protein n=1 Tax=Fukomys damarensis TaxID=885580 RepID=A0A091E2V4_FUKDA|nr:hypothetical protein H920_09192 [Fukomys damarensis]
MMETGEAAYPVVPDNAVHAVRTTQSGAYKEADKASVEMDDKQRSAAIKREREEEAAAKTGGWKRWSQTVNKCTDSNYPVWAGIH